MTQALDWLRASVRLYKARNKQHVWVQIILLTGIAFYNLSYYCIYHDCFSVFLVHLQCVVTICTVIICMVLWRCSKVTCKDYPDRIFKKKLVENLKQVMNNTQMLKQSQVISNIAVLINIHSAQDKTYTHTKIYNGWGFSHGNYCFPHI